MITDKQQPQAPEIEMSVLGGILIDKYGLPDAIEILSPEMFYSDRNKYVFKACLDISAEGSVPDIYLVSEYLKNNPTLDKDLTPLYLTDLTAMVSTSAQVRSHSLIVKQKHVQREIIRLSAEASEESFKGADVFETLESLQTELSTLNSQLSGRAEVGSDKAFYEFTKHVEGAKKAVESGEMVGIPIGIAALDSVLKGWRSPDLVVVAARPGMGKTAFTKAIINGAVDYLQKPVGMFSLEMSTLQLISRLVSEKVDITANDLLSGNVTTEDFTKINSAYGSYFHKHKNLLYIDDTAALSIMQFKARARRMVQEYGCCLLIVDYIQLMEASYRKGRLREGEISEISRGLKQVAKELNVPIIALSQLNRSVETTTYKKPTLAHLRESGAIEQDADIVMFIFRAYYYYQQNPDDEMFANVTLPGVGQVDSKGIAEIIIAKHRNGELKNIPIKFEDRLTKFSDLDAVNEYANLEPVKPNEFIEPPENEENDQTPF